MEWLLRTTKHHSPNSAHLPLRRPIFVVGPLALLGDLLRLYFARSSLWNVSKS
jgi:hypothetical protein